jgi:hypothetical protein
MIASKHKICKNGIVKNNIPMVLEINIQRSKTGSKLDAGHLFEHVVGEVAKPNNNHHHSIWRPNASNTTDKRQIYY